MGAVRGIGLGNTIQQRRRAASLACVFDLLAHLSEKADALPPLLWKGKRAPADLIAGYRAIYKVPHPAALAPMSQRREAADAGAELLHRAGGGSSEGPPAPYPWTDVEGAYLLPSEIEKLARNVFETTDDSFEEAYAQTASHSGLETRGGEDRLPPFFASRKRRASLSTSHLATRSSKGPAPALLLWCVCGLCVRAAAGPPPCRGGQRCAREPGA